MFIKIEARKNTYSNIIMLLFVAFLAIGTVVSEFFRTPEESNTEFSKYRTLFSKEELDNIVTMKLSNRLGEFEFKKVFNETGALWMMENPRKFPVDNEIMKKLFRSLKDIKIRRVYQNDVINYSNYSLDSPLVELKVSNAEGVEDSIKFGLVNPIDNSTYVYTSGKDAIYHIDALAFTVESLDLSDFVDSRIFTQSPDQISSIKVYRGALGKNRILHLRHAKNKWIGSNGKPLDDQKVSEYFNELLSLKSLFILDKASDELKEKVEEYLSKPIFTVEIIDLNQISYIYEVTTVINKLPDLKFEKRKNFIMRASNRDYPYLVEKDFLKYFNLNESRLKANRFKKLFY